MSMETDLVALLKTVCARTFPDVAPAGTATPYITWQALGGEAMRYGDGTAPDKRNTLIQVSVWSKTRSEALSIVHQVDDAKGDSDLIGDAAGVLDVLLPGAVADDVVLVDPVFHVGA